MLATDDVLDVYKKAKKRLKRAPTLGEIAKCLCDELQQPIDEDDVVDALEKLRVAHQL